MTAIHQAITFGYFCAMAGGVITLALAYDTIKAKHFRFTLPVAIVMLLIHPAWTVSANHGDCGGQKIQLSIFFTAIYLGLITFQHMTSKRADTSKHSASTL